MTKATATGHEDLTDKTMLNLAVREEEALCTRWHEHYDIDAAGGLIGRHLYLIAEIATAHRACGLGTQELIGEGYVGLMRAVCRYDPACGATFATYATWWIQGAIQQSILCASPSMQADPLDPEAVAALPPLYARAGRQIRLIQSGS
jgi:DNA-directed RNA polymerase sigma subunit (sigma70/sigma32)